MDFSIEAPGEANPLTVQNLYNVLISASSANRQQVKVGAQQLSNWETHPNFNSSLQVWPSPSLATPLTNA